MTGAAVYTVETPRHETPSFQAALDRRFAAAARHSRFVRRLRVAVPATVALALAAVIGISVFNPFRTFAALPLQGGNLVVSGTKIAMEAPRLNGFSRDQRPYELEAKTATQDLTDPDHLDLETVRAKFLMEDQSTVTVTSRTGRFDTKAQMLDLRQDVVVQTTTGYDIRLNQALVDLGAGAVSTDDGVDVTMTNGTVKARRMRVTNKGDVIRFEGDVVMVLVPDTPLGGKRGENAQAAEPEVAAPRVTVPPQVKRSPSSKRNAAR